MNTQNEMVSFTELFRLEMRNLSRSISDVGWETEDILHIQRWKEAQAALGEIQASHEGAEFTILIDYSNGIERLEIHYEVMKRLHDESRTEELEFIQEPVYIPITVKATNSGKRPWSEGMVLSKLYDVFLIMNLSAPGSFDLYSATLHPERGSSTPLRLSNYLFDVARVKSLEGAPLCPNVISLESTLQWFDTVRSGLRQIPQNPTEKCLFALLHMSSGEISAPTSAWIFYALESILQTSSGQNFNAIRDRAALVLGVDDRTRKRLQKGLREVYDMRSSFVHGGMAIGHPLQDENIDREVDAFIGGQMKASDFGCSLIISLLQRLIGAGVPYPEFKEVLLTTSLR